jgi:hypothetical protein
MYALHYCHHHLPGEAIKVSIVERDDLLELLALRRERWPFETHVVTDHQGVILARSNWTEEEHKVLDKSRKAKYGVLKKNVDDDRPKVPRPEEPPMSCGFRIPTKRVKKHAAH